MWSVVLRIESFFEQRGIEDRTLNDDLKVIQKDFEKFEKLTNQIPNAPAVLLNSTTQISTITAATATNIFSTKGKQ